MRTSLLPKIPQALSFEGICGLVFLATLLCAAIPLYQSYGLPLFDGHGFRQTQTAISSFWMLREGTILPYQTPVFGAPWMIPYEFPLYQALAAAVAALGVPLDFAGRLVSFCFMLLLTIPLLHLTRVLTKDAALPFLTGSLYLSSPLYLHWGRAFLMETTALFFCFTGAVLAIDYVRTDRKGYLLLAALAGTLGTLTKATTYPQCALLAGGVALFLLLTDATPTWKTRCQKIVLLGVTAAIPVLAAFWWVHSCDGVKAASYLGFIHLSASLQSWYSMNLPMLFDASNLLLDRMLPEIFGTPWTGLLFVGILLCAPLPTGGLALLYCLCFLAPFVLFTKVELVHNYYQVSNGVFLILAVGLAFHTLRNLRRSGLALALLALCLGLNYSFYVTGFYTPTREVVRQETTQQTLQIAAFLKEHTQPGSIVFLFGRDWNPEIPYYSERKSVALPFWTPLPQLSGCLEHPENVTGGPLPAAVVRCPSPVGGDNADYDAQADAFIRQHFGTARVQTIGDCRVLVTADAP